VRTLRGLRDALSTLRVGAKVHDLDLSLALSPPQRTPEELLDLAFDTGERMAERDGRRLVVLLDEFQEVDRIGGRDLFRRLRALMQAHSHTAYLFLGSRPPLLRSLFSRRAEAFYRFALPLDMPPIPDNAWRQYLTQKLEPHRLSMTESAVNLLLERTGGHPWCTMEVISEAWVMRADANVITAEDTERGYRRALERMTPIYEAEWQEVRRIRYADAVLRNLVVGAPASQGDAHRTTITRALRHLTDTAILERGAKRGEYRFVEKMFGDWVRSYT
jgi:hypothetical protein